MIYNVEPLRTQDEINDFLFFLRRRKTAERDSFLFLFGINTGLRMSDIVCRKVGEVRGNLTPKIVEKKTGKTRTLHIENLQERIFIYTKDMADDDYLFPSREGNHIKVNTVYKILQSVGANLGRSDIGTHTLRKTFGYHYYRKTHDIATLMQIFNHSSERITKRYIGLTEEEIGDTLKDFKLGF